MCKSNQELSIKKTYKHCYLNDKNWYSAQYDSLLPEDELIANTETFLQQAAVKFSIAKQSEKNLENKMQQNKQLVTLILQSAAITLPQKIIPQMVINTLFF